MSYVMVFNGVCVFLFGCTSFSGEYHLLFVGLTLPFLMVQLRAVLLKLGFKKFDFFFESTYLFSCRGFVHSFPFCFSTSKNIFLHIIIVCAVGSFCCFYNHCTISVIELRIDFLKR